MTFLYPLSKQRSLVKWSRRILSSASLPFRARAGWREPTRRLNHRPKHWHTGPLFKNVVRHRQEHGRHVLESPLISPAWQHMKTLNNNDLLSVRCDQCKFCACNEEGMHVLRPTIFVTSAILQNVDAMTRVQSSFTPLL